MIKIYFSKIENMEICSKRFTRSVIGEYLNLDGKSLVICTNEFGKPYLKDYPNVHYNISHKDEIIVCAISNEPIGVDIEVVNSINERVLKRFFSDEEKRYILSMVEGRAERFIEVWTQKESYVKWRGRGMSIPFYSFDVFNVSDALIYTKYIDKYIISVCVSSNLSFKRKISYEQYFL